MKNHTGSWRTFRPVVNFDKCISCGICTKVCPEGIVILEPNKEYNKLKPIVDYNYCKGCGICAEECPVKAIVMEIESK